MAQVIVAGGWRDPEEVGAVLPELLAQVLAQAPTAAADCIDNPDSFCGVIYDLTGNRTLAHMVNWFVARPLAILLIVVLAAILLFLVRRSLDRFVRHVVEGKPSRLFGRGVDAVVAATYGPALERRRQRTEAMGSVLKSVASFVIVSVAILMILSELGFDLTPALASAGIAGVALSFGAQNLVRDFLAGLFVVFEDQYGVGDWIDTGLASGTVEAVGLRVTQLRDVNGVIWYVRNGEVTRVGNSSQGVARVVLDVAVGYKADVDVVRALLEQTARDFSTDPKWADRVADDEPEVWGVEAVSPDSLSIRLVMSARPGQRASVTRELRARVKATLDAHDIEMPMSQRTMWLHQQPLPPEPTGSDETT